MVLAVKTAKPAYPKTVGDFRRQFASEDACIQYLIESRWTDGFSCPRCEHDTYWYLTKRKLLVCRSCRKETSPIAGTLMHGSHVPIQEWFWAAYLVTTLTPGISALLLQRQLGLGSYRTAWFMLNRLRKGMVSDSRSRLSGIVEADETIIGGPIKNKRGRGVTHGTHKSLVVGAVGVIPYVDKKGVAREKAGRLRLAVIQNADEEAIGGFLNKNVEPGSEIRSDGWRGYSKTALKGYHHDKRIVGSPERAHLVAPHIHRAFSNLKTWLTGTHHGVEPKYLTRYLDEYVFRFNRRQTPMAAFQTLLGIASSIKPMSLAQLRA
jgi:transposase-like protein